MKQKQRKKKSPVVKVKGLKQAKAAVYKYLSKKENMQSFLEEYPEYRQAVENLMQEYRQNGLIGRKNG